MNSKPAEIPQIYTAGEPWIYLKTTETKHRLLWASNQLAKSKSTHNSLGKSSYSTFPSFNLFAISAIKQFTCISTTLVWFVSHPHAHLCLVKLIFLDFGKHSRRQNPQQLFPKPPREQWERDVEPVTSNRAAVFLFKQYKAETCVSLSHASHCRQINSDKLTQI